MIQTETMTIEEYRELGARPIRKYRNVRVEVDGRKFDSKLEARRYEELKLWQKAGQVSWFTCQVPFRLPGGITYRADFLVVMPYRIDQPDGFQKISIEDCKGAKTRVSINKIKQVEALYGIKVQIITRERYRR